MHALLADAARKIGGVVPICSPRLELLERPGSYILRREGSVKWCG